MNRPYLFGPVDRRFAAQKLKQHREDGLCTTFDVVGGADITINLSDNWQTICDRLPTAQRPEFVVLFLPYRSIPSSLWTAPVPIIGLAPDWNLLWHYYRRCLPRCDLVVVDNPGVPTLQADGLDHAIAANLFGCESSFLEPVDAGERDIDILFAGDFHPAVHRERLPWLARVAQLADDYEVQFHTGVFGSEYQKLLARSRIVFDRSVRGKCNRRTVEAASAGALLFQEAENEETRQYFVDGQEVVYYTDEDCEELLRYYLDNEQKRKQLAEAAQQKAANYSFESIWHDVLAQIEEHWPQSVERSQARPQIAVLDELCMLTWQEVNSTDPSDVRLETDLAKQTTSQMDASACQTMLGLVAAKRQRQTGSQQHRLVAEHFERAVAADPDNIVARLNLAEVLFHAQRTDEAVQHARAALTRLQQTGDADNGILDLGHFPIGYDTFRMEWERAAWANAGRPNDERDAKRQLLHWRLHSMLGEATNQLHHFYEAALLRPDLPETRGALGCALGRTKQFAEATAHLATAVRANPFDQQAARALFSAAGEIGDVETQRRLARNRRRLAKAAPALCPPESWFGDAAPVGDELASIIILCCNELEYTRQCFESVFRHTRAPYELILVDNGSTDGTAEYLEEISGRSEPNRITIIRNEANKGFPTGCNQGLAKARGAYLVFLNNDTIVTPKWLDRLVAWSLHDWPKVGMVGAVTNYSRPPQKVPADYQLDQLDEFADKRRREYRGKALTTTVLTGFCLLARREVLQTIGDFDEQYGFGFFDDDDLSVRACEAGFKLLVALDVFIHHFGSRTFLGMGVDTQKQLQDNFQRFHEKWGSEHSSCYKIKKPAEAAPAPDHHVESQLEGDKPKISLCMIVKNEEENLPACLESVADLCDEIVVVDTGSEDATKDIAVKMGAKVFDFPWIDHFAAARNESLEHATGQWVFWMDADDRVDEENRPKLKKLFDSLGDDNAAYVLKCKCLPDPITRSATVVDHVRLFRNHPQIRWKYRIHEQILPAVRRLDGEVRWSDVVINHTGYQDPNLRQRKLQRDLRILTLEHQEQPDDPFTLFNLGSVYQEQSRWSEALDALQKSLERSQTSDSIVRKLYASIAQCQKQLGRKEQALQTCAEGRKHYPQDAELSFREGVLRRDDGDLPGAEQCFLKALQTREGNHFASVVDGIQGYKSRYNLAVIYKDQGRFAEAETQWKAAVDEKADFVAAWMGLGEMYLSQKRWAEVEQTITQLHPAGAKMEHQVLRARLDAARGGDLAAVRKLLEDTIAEFPQELYPQVILSELLMPNQKNWPAAERVLRGILELCPDHQESKNRLSIVSQQGSTGNL